MNCSIKTQLSPNVFVQTKAIFRINKTICWMTTVYDNTAKLLGGTDRECIAFIENPQNIGYCHLNRCSEIKYRLENLK